MSRNKMIAAAAIAAVLLVGLLSWYATGPEEPVQDRTPTTEQGGTVMPPPQQR
ncbi:MAG: hypothetical protein ACK4QW_08440 [Alphaproteobacteria bacterium]